MTSSNGNIVRVTGHLCGEFTGLRWIPRTKASDAEQGSHSSWKIIEIQICFKIMEKSLNFMKSSWNL